MNDEDKRVIATARIYQQVALMEGMKAANAQFPESQPNNETAFQVVANELAMIVEWMLG